MSKRIYYRKQVYKLDKLLPLIKKKPREKFRFIPTFGNRYIISNFGRVFSVVPRSGNIKELKYRHSRSKEKLRNRIYSSISLSKENSDFYYNIDELIYDSFTDEKTAIPRKVYDNIKAERAAEKLHKDEVFKKIPGFWGKYQISNYGKLRSYNLRSGRIYDPGYRYLSHRRKGPGYHSVNLRYKNKSAHIQIHKKMAELFLKRPRGAIIVKFKNGNYDDLRVNNLYWAYNQGTYKLKKSDVIDIKKGIQEGFPPVIYSKKYKVSISTIYDIMKNITWKHVKI